MADYKLQARIPQETADKLFNVIKELQEVTTVADVTTSSIVRSLLDNFIKEHENKNIKIEIENSKVHDEELEEVISKMLELIDSSKNEVVKQIYTSISKALLQEKLNRL